MKKIGLLFLVIISIAACNSAVNESGELKSQADVACNDNTWLENTIAALEAAVDQKAEIIQYRFNNEIVYLVDNCLGCADAMQVVYNCSGDERCTFGGIAGFNTCPDFFETATDKKVVWHN